ncbi:unnamed protein product [Amaranthus hypochondriacus]
MDTDKVVDDDESKKVELDNPKRVDDEYPNYIDDDYESSVETDPRWGRELNSDGEPIYSPEPADPNHVYNAADALFADSDDDEWLDSLGPFTRMQNCNSTEGLRLNGVSPTLGDANSVSNAGMPIERGLNPQVNETCTPLPPKQLLSIVGTTTPNRAQVARTQSNPIPQPSPLSRVKTTTTHCAQVARVQSNPVPQPSPLFRVETNTSHGAQTARIQSNPIQNMGPHDQGQAKRLKQNEVIYFLFG